MKVKNIVEYNNQARIEHYVYCVFKDIIAHIKLDRKIIVRHHIKLTLVNHLTPGILFMEVDGTLIGICDVKQPLNVDEHYGFNLNYIYRIK